MQTPYKLFFFASLEKLPRVVQCASWTRGSFFLCLVTLFIFATWFFFTYKILKFFILCFWWRPYFDVYWYLFVLVWFVKRTVNCDCVSDFWRFCAIYNGFITIYLQKTKLLYRHILTCTYPKILYLSISKLFHRQ